MGIEHWAFTLSYIITFPGFCFIFHLESQSRYIAQAVLELEILLLQSPTLQESQAVAPGLAPEILLDELVLAVSTHETPFLEIRLRLASWLLAYSSEKTPFPLHKNSTSTSLLTQLGSYHLTSIFSFSLSTFYSLFYMCIIFKYLFLNQKLKRFVYFPLVL